MKKLIYLLYIGIVFFALSCSDTTRGVKKFDNFPNDAFWKGGVDGGHWFHVNNFNDSSVSISIFNEYDGKLIKTTNFRLGKECSKTRINFGNLKDLIINYDLTKINLNLKDSNYEYLCYLEEVN